MTFNSFPYLILLAIIFVAYWVLLKEKYKWQNLLLLAASLFFYGWWDWRFLSLITFSAVIDYLIGNTIEKEENTKKRKSWLVLSLVLNLGFLGFFKYYNFFIAEFAHVLEVLGMQTNDYSLHIILPVGISFYTFQTLSYTIDIYKRKIRACKDFVPYMLYVSFFPQLVAGPIERAEDILPQLTKERELKLNQIRDGLKQILWGLVKKVVIADNCARFLSYAFHDPTTKTSGTLIMGAVFFTIQIYADFSAYSDIAIGSSNLFGIKLKKNFDFPLFAKTIPEFWRRWHISLMNWFRDYIYIPLGGSRTSTPRFFVNIFIVFFLSGLWHGANWTFIAFGLTHAIAYTMYIVYKKYFQFELPNMLAWVFTFIVVVVGFTFFRSPSISFAFNYLGHISFANLFSIPKAFLSPSLQLVFISFFFTEWLGRKQEYAIENTLKQAPWVIRWLFYYLLIFIIFFFYNTPVEFIYFQF